MIAPQALASRVCVGAPGGVCDDTEVTIQDGVNAASNGDEIAIAAGDYYEDVTVTGKTGLTITGAGRSQTFIRPIPGQVYGPGANWDRALLKFDGGSTADVSGLSLKGPNNPGACGTPGTPGSPALLNYGLLVEDAGTDVDFHDADVISIREQPLSGCQYDHGIRYRDGASGEIYDVAVSDFQKNGITISGAGTDVDLHDSTVTGVGPTPVLAQNGVQISFGADANVHQVDVSDVQCTHPSCGPDPWANTESSGFLVYNSGANTVIHDNTVTQSDMGLVSLQTMGSEAEFYNNDSHDNTVIGGYADAGSVSFHDNSFRDNPRGLFVASYAGQAAAPDLDLRSNNFTGNTIAGITFQDDGSGAAPNVTSAGNRFFGNAAGAEYRAGSTGAVTLENNWWGCNDGPNSAGGCDSADFAIDVQPWLVMGVSAPSTAAPGSNVPITSETSHNSDGDDVSSLGTIPDTPIAGVGDFGVTVSPASQQTASGASSFNGLLDNGKRGIRLAAPEPSPEPERQL